MTLDEDLLRRVIREELGAAQLPRLLTRREVADLLRVHPRDLRRLVLQGAFPPGIQVGRRVRWQARVVEKWLDGGGTSRLHVTTMTAGRSPTR